MKLSRLEKKLCNALQRGLPVCTRPFAQIAEELGCEEAEVLHLVGKLKAAGVVRRVRAMINHRTLGRTGTLVAAHVETETLKVVTAAVNELEGVSHNYLRSHDLNLWFTLQGSSDVEIEQTLSRLGERLGVEFHSLPVIRVFKLDVRFDAESEGETLLEDEQALPSCEPVELGIEQKRVLSSLSEELEVTSRPFAFLAKQEHEQADVLRTIQELLEARVIRRIAGVMDHRKLGFTANLLLAADVPQDRIEQAGQRLARFGIVSHCYERRTFAGWPYNLFAMMHGRSMGRIQHTVERFVEAEGIESFELLVTESELKKQPVTYKL